MYLFNQERMVIIKYDSVNNYINEYKVTQGIFEYGLSFQNSKPLMSIRNSKRKDDFTDIEFFHILNYSFQVEKTLKIDYPRVFAEYSLHNFTRTDWKCSNDYIYVLFQVSPYIYQYDLTGKLINILGWLPEDYKMPIKKVEINLPFREKMILVNAISFNSYFAMFKNRYLYFSYSHRELSKNFTDEDLDSQENRHFGEILLTTKGEQIEIDHTQFTSLKDMYKDKNGYAYELTGEPDKREIKVYEIIIEKKN